MIDDEIKTGKWLRVADDPPSGACTLRLPVEVTDGKTIWETTTSGIPYEDGSPLWWRIKESK